MKMKDDASYLKIIVFWFFLWMSQMALAQEDYLIGFQEAIEGRNFAYHSPNSPLEKSIIIRNNKDFPPLVWKTQVLPESFKGNTASFVWLYGIHTGPEQYRYSLSVNGKPILSFINPTKKNGEDGETKGAGGSRLLLRQTMVDVNKDQMGYAVLTVPTTLLKKGEAATIKIEAEHAQSSAWYMTYKVALKNEFSAFQLNTVTKKEGVLYNTVRFDLIHIGRPVKATITLNNERKAFTLNTGLNEIDFLVPKVDRETRSKAIIQVGTNRQEQDVLVKPVKEWTVHLVQHSHTDIGYTRQQSEILAEHLRYIDDALDFCDQTDGYPENAQFRWTCEAAWTVREYLNSRPTQQIERLLKRIGEGRIEVTGMFFNFSEIIDETALAIQLRALNAFKEKGIDVTAAMQNDVNGIGWCMVDYYNDTGVKYLTMGQHGHRAHVPFHKPTAFWWESPSGKQLLAYRSEHYMHGNALALTSGNIDVFRNNLSQYLLDLEAKEYPLDRTAFQFSGYITDNSPPSTRACDIVREWNEKYEWPKLKLSLDSEFMIYLDKNHGDQLERRKVAWPDWWTDGFGSAMNETKTARSTHANMIATMGLLTMAQASGAKLSPKVVEEVYRGYDNLLFYDEHTFGADESISNPNSENTINQWRQKASYVWSANQQSNILREKAIGLIQPYVTRSNVPTVTVFNTLNWKRSGSVEVYIDHDKLPLDTAFKIMDEDGHEVPAQLLRSRPDGSYWSLWVQNVPPLGYRNYRILVSSTLKKKQSQNPMVDPIFENNFYKVTLDLERNGIASIWDKELNKELVDSNSTYRLGTMVYELLNNRRDLERLTNTLRDTVYKPLKKEIVTLREVKITGTAEGAIWKSVFLNGRLPECADEKGVHIELRLYHDTKKIELLYDMVKLENSDPEGVFITFPFSSEDDGQLAFEVQGGLVYPGKNQLEGTASDWNTIQNFARVTGNNAQIVFCSGDVPLVHFGNINTGRYYYKHEPENGHIYSWVLNNYWVTNFRASQRGELKWKYQITSSGDTSISLATRFGTENRIPMIARAYSAGNKNMPQVSKTIIDLNTPKNLLLVNSRPTDDGKGILLHLRETEGGHALLDVSKILQNPNLLGAWDVNVLGEKRKELGDSLLIEHFETKFIRLEVAP
ncbi:MAG: hypothetical protein AAGA86_05060 [Bacteroidota bacterium]